MGGDSDGADGRCPEDRGKGDDSSPSHDRLGEIFCQEKESLVKKQYQISKRRAAARFEEWRRATRFQYSSHFLRPV